MSTLDEQLGGWRIRGATAAGIFAAIVLGFLGGRLFPPRAEIVRTESSLRTTATPAAPYSQPHLQFGNTAPTASVTATKKSTDLQDSRYALDEELAQVPELRTADLNAIGESIRQDRLWISQIRGQLYDSDRELLLEGSANAPDTGARMLAYQQKIQELEEELSDAKLALSDQQKLVETSDGPEDSIFMMEIRAELKRRSDTVAQLQNEVQSLFGAQALDINLISSQRAQRYQAWRQKRAGLESAYGEALVSLEEDTQAYRDVAAENAANQKRIESLKKARAALDESVLGRH